MFVLWSATALRAQVYVNREWERTSGLPDALDWSATSFDINKNVLVTGNTLIAPGNPDILLVKLDPQGNVMWQRTYGGNAGAQDYGVATVSDQLGNIYVAGVVTSTTSLMDVVVLKYSPSGSLLWAQTFNGPANNFDVPSSMALGTDGSIYVAGTTYSAPNQPDYLLWKLNVNSSSLWHSTYDHNGLIDVATSVLIDGDGSPIVTGASASTSNAWDYATVKYAAATGAEQDVARVNVPGLGLDNALAFTRSDQGSIYITGYREVNGSRDMQTVKLNTAFNVEWVNEFDGYGLNDEARSIDADADGNVYICGTSRTAQGGSEIVTIKYGPSGAELWRRRSKPAADNLLAEGRRVAVTQDGGVIVLGSVQNGTSFNFRTLKYLSDGSLEWTEEYDKLSGNDMAMDLLVDDDKVYVSGTSETPNGNGYTTVKYTYTKLENGILTGTGGTPLCKANEVLVKFHIRDVNTAVVDNKGWQYGKLGDVVPTAIADAIGDQLGLPAGTGKNIKTYKVFRDLTTADSISTRRLGGEDRLPKFWATFLMEVDLANTPDTVLDQLNSLTEEIEYAQLNHLYRPLSDPLYPARQQGLTPSVQYLNGDINVEAAWDITTGIPEVKVGVVDELIEYYHPDFETGSAGSSKVIAGWSYNVHESLEEIVTANDYVVFPHGTACAGVIAAVRNNGEGIAGIAGGNADVGDYGCSLISLGIFDAENVASTAAVANALLDGALETGGMPNSFACHILNNSYGHNGYYNYFNDQTVRRAAYTVFRNECVFVAAKGNGGSPPHFPADFGPDQSVLSVGASGWDGSLMTPSNGGYLVTAGSGMDLIAPGSPEMVTTTIGQYEDFPYNSACAPLPERYDCFLLSSSAASHASGVAALMLSEHNVLQGYANDLAPEDVQYVMEKGATDIIGTPLSNPYYTVGYDGSNGWGRLNAGEAVRLVHTPYRVFHSGEPDLQDVVPGAIQTIDVFDNNGENNTWDLGPGLHQVQPVVITNTFTNNFGPNTTVLDGLGGQPGYWGRLSTVEGLLDFFGNQSAEWEFSLSGSILSVTATTICYRVLTGPNNEPIDRWVPVPPDKVETPYSVHLLDDFVVGQDEPERPSSELHAFPNPANEAVRITWLTPDVRSLDIFDSLGRHVYSKTGLGNGQLQLDLNTSAWAEGLYTVHAHGGTQRLSQRFVKLQQP